MDLAIRDLSAARRKRIVQAKSRTGRERGGLFLLEGRRLIEEALARGVTLTCIVVDDEAEGWIRERAAAGTLDPAIEICRTGRGELARLADTVTPQGMVAIGAVPDLALAALPADPGPLALIADGIQDPGNLGTLLRTLAAVGGRAALCARGTVDPYNPKALRGAAGATFAVSVATSMTGAEAAEWCADRGAALIALSAGAPDLFAAELPQGRLALAVGNEGRGLSPEIAGRAALSVGLPMAAGVESLSAAVAGSVALYALAHRLVAARPRSPRSREDAG